MRNYPFFFNLEEHWIKVPYTNLKRRVRVLLPRNYHRRRESFPVVYMQDGQNIFFDNESYSKYSWRVIQTLRRYRNLPDLIVVAIDNFEDDRSNEYSPWRLSSSPYPEDWNQGGYGQAYASFLLEEVKPYIDERYRTRPQREYTAVCGSSLGANISAYIGANYPDIVGRLGIFSLASWISKEDFKGLFERDLDKEQKIYIQVGTEEGYGEDRRLSRLTLNQAYIDSSLDYHQALIRGGLPIENIKLEIIAGARHEEKAWARAFSSCLEFLSEGW